MKNQSVLDFLEDNLELNEKEKEFVKQARVIEFNLQNNDIFTMLNHLSMKQCVGKELDFTNSYKDYVKNRGDFNNLLAELAFSIENTLSDMEMLTFIKALCDNLNPMKEKCYHEERIQNIRALIEQIEAVPFRTQWFKSQFKCDRSRIVFSTENEYHELYRKALKAYKLETYILSKELCNDSLEDSIELFYRSVYKSQISVEDMLMLYDVDSRKMRIIRSFTDNTTTYEHLDGDIFVFRNNTSHCEEMNISSRLPFCGEYTFQKYLIG